MIRKSERNDIFGMMEIASHEVPHGLSVRRAVEHLREGADIIEQVQDMLDRSEDVPLDPEAERICRIALRLGGVCGSLVDEIRRGHHRREEES